jgi:hypothetical protein
MAYVNPQEGVTLARSVGASERSGGARGRVRRSKGVRQAVGASKSAG